MGNVLATTALSSPPPIIPPPPPSSSSSTGLTSKETSENAENDSNPGTMEDLHRKCKDVFPMPFDGARLIINKALSNHFQVSHTLTMNSGTLMPPGYRFGATYIGTHQISPSEAYPIFFGDTDPSGNLNARILHLFNNKYKVQIGAQIQDSKCVATQFTTDYRGSDYTASLTLGNVDLINSSGIAVLHYLQKVTPKIALGAELAYQYGPQVPGGEIASVSVAGRYSSPNNFTVSGTLGNTGAHICYYQKGSENVQVGVEVETSLRAAESVATFGYQIDLPKANVVFRAMVDSNWSVGAVLEKKLLPLPFTFVLSGLMNHSKNQTKIGTGLYLG